MHHTDVRNNDELVRQGQSFLATEYVNRLSAKTCKMTPAFYARRGDRLVIIDPRGATLAVTDALAADDMHVAAYRGVIDFDATLAQRRLSDRKWGAMARGAWVEEPTLDMLMPFSQGRSFAGRHVATSVTWNVQFYCFQLVDETLTRLGDLDLHEVRPFFDGTAPALPFDASDIENTYVRPSSWGLLDSAGGWRLPPTFDSILNFSDGLAEFQSNKRNGYLLPNGEIAIEPRYASSTNFHEGLAQVAVEIDDALRWGVIDRQGQQVHPFELPHPTRLGFHGTFEHGSNRLAFKHDGKWGFFEIGGEVMVAPQFESTYGFREGLAAVRKNGKYGFIDPSGAEVVPYAYHHCRSFREGRAAAQAKVKSPFNPRSKILRWGYINAAGEWSIEPKFVACSSFHDSHALVMLEGDRFALINQSGDTIWEE